MADSDNTRVCPSVTRRKLLTATMAVAAMWPFQNGKAAAVVKPTGNNAFDPAISLWHEWRAACLHTAALRRKQQGLKIQLINAIGFPRAEVHLSDEDATIPISCYGDIEELFGDNPAFAEVRAKAEAGLAAHQARWDAEDERIGYSDAKREELAAAEHEEELADALASAPATTLAGIAGKLDAILREGESWEEPTEFPWPQIRSALGYLISIAQAAEPGLLMPGSDCREPYPRIRREACCFRVEKRTCREAA